MLDVPPATPDTVPPTTVALVISDEDQGVVKSGEPDPDNNVLLETQVDKTPVIVGKAFTVNTVGKEVHPTLSVNVMFTVPAPARTPVTFPDASTDAIKGLEDVQGEEAAATPE